MAVSPFTASAAMPVWQDPYVEVIKFGMNHRSVGWFAQGDVEQTQDPLLHKNVFRIRGAIAATNYLRVPRDASSGTQGLGLSGRFIYIQLRCIQDLPVTLHLDVVTTKKTALRFTLSSLFQSLRSTGIVLRVPLLLTNQWTVVAIDAVQLLKLHTFNQYAREQYHHLKSVTLCAAMNARNVFTSATQYTQQTLPSALRFPDDMAAAKYDWHTLPAPDTTTLQSPYRKSKRTHDLDAIASSPVEQHTLPREYTQRVNNQREFDASSPRKRDALGSPSLTKQQSPPRADTQPASPSAREHALRRDRAAILSKADQIVRDAGISHRNVSAHGHTATASPRSTATVAPRSKQHRAAAAALASVTATEWPDPLLTLEHIVGFSNVFPHALLWLRGNNTTSCVYASASTIVVRDVRRPSSIAAVVPVDTTTATRHGSVDAIDSTADEHFLQGHSAPVCGLALSSDGALLASIELGANSVRVWSMARRECVTALKAHARGVHALCFSAADHPLRLCAVGHDDAHRVQILVWDCSALQDAAVHRCRPNTVSSSAGAIPVIARQTCDFPVTTIAFSPYERDQLVTCGKENVRVWRIRKRHVAGSPVVLNAYARGTEFTDVGFDPLIQAFPSNMAVRVRPLYVSTSRGTLVVIDYDTRCVVCVYTLHSAAITSVSINEGFCVTGADDAYLRVWPLDFTDFFLEAQHDAGVASVDVSLDGLCVLVGSRNGAIGVLDIADQRYDTVLRSHTDAVTAMALSPISLLGQVDSDATTDTVGERDEIVTTARDGTLRIWAAASGQQLFEFAVEHDAVTCLVASPTSPSVLAVGFASGCVRVFDVHDTTATPHVACAVQQHASALCTIAFDTDGACLYTSAVGRQLCLYDACDRAYTPVKMLIADLFTDTSDAVASASVSHAGKFCLSADKKCVAMISADRQRIVLLHAKSLRAWCALTPNLGPTSSTMSTSSSPTLKDVLISPNAHELVALSSADRLFVYSLESLQLVQSMQLLVAAPITAIALSPNNKYFATGSADGALSVWRWAEHERFRRMQQRFVGQMGAIKRIGFTSDGTRVITTGTASTLFIWRCHGESGQSVAVAPTQRTPLTASERQASTLAVGGGGVDDTNSAACGVGGISSSDGAIGSSDDATADDTAATTCASNQQLLVVHNTHCDDACDPEEMSPSLHVPVPSAKPQFSLQLAMDALVLHQQRGSAARDVRQATGSSDDDEKDNRDSTSNSNVAVSTLELSTTERGTLTVSSVVQGVRPRHVAWSHTSGQLVFAVGTAVVVEQLATGSQSICCVATPRPSANATDAIVSMWLSPSRLRVATVTTALDKIAVARIDKTDSRSSSICLPRGVASVDAIEFVFEDERSVDDSVDDDSTLLCFSCRAQAPNASGLFIANVATGAIAWSRTGGSALIDSIVAVACDTFVTLASASGRFETHVFTVDSAVERSDTDDDDDSSHISDVTVTSRTVVESLTSPIQIVCASPWRDTVRSSDGAAVARRQHVLLVDHEAFCSVVDLARNELVATSQFMLHASEQQRRTGRNAVPIHFLEWLDPAQTQCVVRASRGSHTLCVHRLPLTSSSSRSSTTVDWQRVARSGLPILYAVALDAAPQSLSVDPQRGLGVIATQDGAVTLLTFRDGAPKRVIKQLTDASLTSLTELQQQQPPPTCCCWAMDDAVLVTLDCRANALRVVVPEVGREVARFGVRGAACTSVAANSAFPPLTDTTRRGAIVLAGFVDGALRVFDVGAMALLAQTQLLPPQRSFLRAGARSHGRQASRSNERAMLKRRRPSTGATPLHDERSGSTSSSSSGDSDSDRAAGITQIHFVGTCVAVVVLADERVVLVDLSDVLQSRDPAIRTRPTNREREIVARDLLLLRHGSCTRSSRSTGRVVAIDVKTDVESSFFASHAPSASTHTVFPFLVVTATAAQVFGRSEMTAERRNDDDDALAPMDTWSLTDSPSARFLAGKQPLVLYVASTQATTGPYCLEVRDYLQQRVLQRIDLGASISVAGVPMLLWRVHRRRSSSNSSSGATTDALHVLANARGDLLALDLARNCVIQIDTEEARALAVAPLLHQSALSVDDQLLLASDAPRHERLAVATITFDALE